MDDDMIGALHEAEEGCNCNSCAVEFRDRRRFANVVKGKNTA